MRNQLILATLTDEQCIGMVKDLLEAKTGLEFQPPIESAIRPSLISVTNTNDGDKAFSYQAMVEIENDLSINTNKVEEIINRVNNFIKAREPKHFYLFLLQPVSQIVNDNLTSGLNEIIPEAFTIWDNDLIQDSLNEYPQIKKKWNIKEYGHQTTSDFETIYENQKFFLTDHIWGSQNKLNHFILTKSWQYQFPSTNRGTWSQIANGDIIILKSTNNTGKNLAIEVVAIGVVAGPWLQKNSVKVNWSEPFNSRILLPKEEVYSNSILLLSEFQKKQVLDLLYEVNGSIKNTIVDLSKNVSKLYGLNSREGLLTVIKLNEVQQKDFWWISCKEQFQDITYNKEYGIKLSIGQKTPKKGELAFFAILSPHSTVDGVVEIKRYTDGTLFFHFIYLFDNKPNATNLISKIEGIENIEISSNTVLHTPFEIFDKLLELTEIGTKKEESKDNIPFHLDQVEVTDRLNRESVAKSLSRLLNRNIFNKKNTANRDRAFMVHLQGAWGEGKSTFLNLLTDQLGTDENKWIVVNFNAWQSQHISPPWWTFLSTIYNGVKGELGGFPYNCLIRIKECCRRVFWYKSFYKIILLLFTAGCIWALYHFRSSLFEFARPLASSDNHDTSTIGFDVKLFKEIIIAFGAIVGAVYSFGKFLADPMFLTSSESAKTFMEHATDPMKKVKSHFESLVHDVDRSGKHLAIYIDDLDRCNAEFTVELLEGIQTLFTDKKVLYVVAGDRQWISTCFENHYKDYREVVQQPAQKLGYLFLEKAFQLSLRLPKVSGDVKKEYWRFILNIQEQEVEKRVEITKDERQEIIQEFKKTVPIGETITTEKREEFKKKYQLEDHQAADIFVEALDEDQEDIKHILQDHHELIDANPRGIKRLANQYNIYRNTLIVEDKEFDKNKLFRWLMLQNKYPMFTDWVEHNLHNLRSEFKLPEEFKSLENDSFWQLLMIDKEGEKGGRIEMDEIAMFIGSETTVN
ncbi:KAP family P-loop NTPase fold protein [Reichenbachiella versicolor]|uniref:KAP family P-loop NTPase fold protein n=1 Tax=Reichenbachiella versicolor TaxID=1821036 RepID=UPI000D6E2FBD|nr:P-loop NTPase fold protein [Reichenbachiella versicolor]